MTGPRGAGKTFTLAWAASELAVLAQAADDERFAWVSARGLTPRVLAWQLAGQLGVTVGGAAGLAAAIGGRLRESVTGAGSESASGLGGSGFGPGVADGVAADGLSGGATLGAGLGAGLGAVPEAAGDAAAKVTVAVAAVGDPGDQGSNNDPADRAARVPASRSATWDLASSPIAGDDVGRWSRVTILISELDLAGHLRDGSAREAVIAELLAPLSTVPGVRLIVESARTDVAEIAAGAEAPATVIDLGEARWTDRAEFAAWLDDLVPSGGAAAPQAYPNPTKAREILSLASHRHAGLLAASDERPWKLAAVPFDVAFREGIADQIVLEPANLVLVQQPALSTAIDALGSAVAPGTRAAWRVAGQALTNSTTIPERAAILHGAALAVGDHSLAEAVAPYTRGTRPSDGATVGDPIPWFTRWAGWRPLPPDTPRPMPWPGPVAALAVAAGLVNPPAAVVDVAAGLAAVPQAGVKNDLAAVGIGGSEPADPGAAPPSQPAEPNLASHPGDPGQASQPGQPTAVAELVEAPPAAHASPGILLTPVTSSSAGAWLPDPEPVPPQVLVAIDDLARAYRLDPRSGRIIGRPAAPVMVKARTAAVVDAAPSLVLTDSSRRLAALGPGAPRGAVAAVRDVLPETVVTAVAVAREALVFGAADGRVHVWHAGTEELIADPEDQHSGAVTAVAAIWMPEVDVLFALSGGQDGTFRLWAVPADASLLPVEDRGVPVTAVTAALTELGPVAAVAWSDGYVTVWDLDDARTGRPIPLGWAPKALALGGDGLLIAAGDDGLIAIDLHLHDFFEG
ncbi:hypothetical protein [Catenulispora pinisilvae]|uniref:hypothetical protein n=2 Tax=Catenulispora pinisilvae TaxID=2705253 RepID=UPI0018927703|nr:hypothetical protein [Catenulispora pinisilvae]